MQSPARTTLPPAPPALAALPVLRLRFTASAAAMRAPHNPGSAWHGGFGKALHDTQPAAYLALYGNDDRSTDNLPRPYVLRPPHTLHNGAQQDLCFEIILIGDAIAHASAVIAAVRHWGQLGVGPDRGQFSLRRVESITPGATAPCHHPEQLCPFSLDQAWQATETSQLRLQLLSPLLLKLQGDHLGQAPDMPLLITRLLHRIDSLLLAHLQAGLPGVLRRQAQQAASTVTLRDKQIRWISQPRYSARQHSWMPFGGLIGQLDYHGHGLTECGAWLGLAEWLHLGNKTTFGHGQIKASISNVCTHTQRESPHVEAYPQ
ncbi:CRISPR system precrRNA processing endoribonuclease RAMP protein Cas6 [Chitinilyticum piscinae]|uniref:CRISPR system precrRNA processing endoribonuclease RAMP protein Cas6 n=1 Tax=Chitinilyticum piscinae TaxID=2866724 RepID=A0A8J7FKC7_9NEIS|nr:CRISPR system precrRNA processing endoribonuclease RAMP protein Cas6 [Chitinilyticum piscinae]MBE9610833.1 CRISPR system precrRNA processing endoribonuclease RAMP protein Cas6 [Chitinilyticum piscinae]